MGSRKEFRETSSYFATNNIVGKKSKFGLRSDGFRSIHEKRFSEYLKALHIKYEFETEGIPIKDSQETNLHYIPDFYLPEKKLYIEIVNNMDKRLRYKIFYFKEQHPDKEIMIITAKEVRNLFLGRTTLF